MVDPGWKTTDPTALCAVLRPDLGFIGLYDPVYGGRVDQTLLNKDGFERAHPRCHLVEFIAVIVGHAPD